VKVFILAAVTADGFIGRDSDHFVDWSGHEDKKVFVRLTKAAGTMIMGSRTFATIGRALPGRRTIVYTQHPERISVPDVETTTEDPKTLLARLESEGLEAVAICGGAAIYDLFMQAGVVNELYLTVVPVLFGQGIHLFHDRYDLELQLLESTPLIDGSVLLHYALNANLQV